MAVIELDSIAITGFRSIASVELALRSINIIIGANGSGKSNFIETFSFLRAIGAGRLQEYVRRAGGAEQLLHFGSQVTREIRIALSFLGGGSHYSLALGVTDDDSVHPANESVYVRDEASSTLHDPDSKPREPVSGSEPPGFPQGEVRIRMRGREAGISDENAGEPMASFRERFKRWHLYHIHDTSADSRIRKTAQLDDNSFLRPDGSNLAAFLYLLRRKHPKSYGLIRGTVQQVAPFFDDFLLRPDPLNEETIRLAWKHKASDQYFGVAALSDGSLRFIALATLFLQPETYRPSVILVDEPELGLHPFAITLLAALVKQAAIKTQVILSTQSSLLLDHFQPEDVLVAD